MSPGSWNDGGQTAPEYGGEACDGLDLGGQSCASLGYKGGTLKCGVSCDFDTAACESCQAGGKVLSCGLAKVDATAPWGIALGATDSEIVLAWGSNASVHLARLNPDLSLLSEAGCVGPKDASGFSLSIAPSGWILAIDTPRGIELLPLDPMLAPRAPSRLVSGAHTPTLVARRLDGGPVAGGPLFVWNADRCSTEYPAPRYVLLSDDALPETPEVTITDAHYTQGSNQSIVFAGDGFLNATEEFVYTDDPQRSVVWHGIAIERIGLDGKLGTRQTPVGQLTVEPTLAWTGSEAHLAYRQYIGSGRVATRWAALDSWGAPLGSSLTINAAFGPLVTFGEDILGLNSGVEPGGLRSKIDVVRLSKTAAIVDGPYSLVTEPYYGYGVIPFIARRGPEAVIAWLGNRGGVRSRAEYIGLARVAP